MTGEEIKKLREARGWKQRQMGEYLGIDPNTVSRLERGDWPPSGPVLKLLDLLSKTPASSTEAA